MTVEKIIMGLTVAAVFVGIALFLVSCNTYQPEGAGIWLGVREVERLK